MPTKNTPAFPSRRALTRLVFGIGGMILIGTVLLSAFYGLVAAFAAVSMEMASACIWIVLPDVLIWAVIGGLALSFLSLHPYVRYVPTDHYTIPLAFMVGGMAPWTFLIMILSVSESIDGWWHFTVLLVVPITGYIIAAFAHTITSALRPILPRRARREKPH